MAIVRVYIKAEMLRYLIMVDSLQDVENIDTLTNYDVMSWDKVSWTGIQINTGNSLRNPKTQVWNIP